MKVYKKVKRAMDLGVSSAVLAASAPIMGAAAIGIWASMGRPIFFRQQRPGEKAQLFHLMKFRTMHEPKHEEERLRSDGARLTRLGQWLRATSVDELPTLINVIKGEMSLVGPRPLLIPYLERYSPEQARRHEVKPGITGWAQINGRNAISWEEKFKLDVWYVDHQSLLLDLKILALTAAKVLRRDGISAAGQATMPEFMGSSLAEK